MEDYEIQECAGCGITNYELSKELEMSLDDIEDESVKTNSGLWYCHRDCFKDSH